ncbi:MAG: thermonuclease family protein [bacterium]|nr:thermonuclease family protein [bacterium]
MKRPLPAGGLLLLIFAFLIGLVVGKATPQTPVSQEVIVPTLQEGVRADAEGYYRVARVLDGDTIELTTGERVRYHGIDAPEHTERWGTVAYETNRDLVEGNTVRIEFDRERRDVYGRILAYVWVEEVMVNERLVEDGLANVFLIKGEAKPKYLSRLQAAEDRAREAARGLWTPLP